ncbi:hypothetical protein J4218_00425 [Candidatus Pacearchaeota archaeon]|nr:hypothetical protein [Candidatus Pacearchaeota archaeon]
MKKIELKKNRKGEMIWDALIPLLLGILVLVGVYYFFFSNYIWDYVRNLPGGNKNNNKDSPVQNITKDDKILAEYYKVGVILDAKYIKFCTKGDCNNLVDSKLYLIGDERQGTIYVDINWAVDKKIGTMINSNVVIDNEIFSGKGVYGSIKEDIPPYADMRNFDKSIYISGILYREKEYVVSANEGFGVQ